MEPAIDSFPGSLAGNDLRSVSESPKRSRPLLNNSLSFCLPGDFAPFVRFDSCDYAEWPLRLTFFRRRSVLWYNNPRRDWSWLEEAEPMEVSSRDKVDIWHVAYDN